MKQIKKNNAQAVVDKRAALDDLRQHQAETEEQSKYFLDYEKLMQDSAEAILEKDTEMEALRDEHKIALGAVREQHSRDIQNMHDEHS